MLVKMLKNEIAINQSNGDTNCFLKSSDNPGAELKIVCFPYAGGCSATYLSWNEWLPTNVELVAIQLPGRANRFLEAPISDMRELVADLIRSSNQLFDKPYILFGHSLGSRIAFEMMRRCQKDGIRPPVHFIASGSRGPHIPPRRDPVHFLPDNEFINEIKKLDGTPKEILNNEESMTLYLPLLKADFKLAETYLCNSNPLFNCPITVFSGEDDKDISKDDLKSWGNYFSNEPQIQTVTGGHFFINSNKQVLAREIMKIIQSELSKLKYSVNDVERTHKKPSYV